MIHHQNNVFKEKFPLQMNNESLSDALLRWQSEFLDNLKLNEEKDPKTISNYATAINFFIDFAYKYDNFKFDTINLKFMQFYFSWRGESFKLKNGKDIQSSTKQNDKKILTLFIDFIEEKNEDNFVFNIKWKKIKFKKIKKEYEFYEEDTQKIFLNYFKKILRRDNNEYAHTISFCFKLGLYSGLRATEICELKLNQFSKPYINEGVKLINLKIHGKGNTYYTNPMPYEYINKELNFFKKNRDINERMFYSRTGKELNRFILYRYIEEIAEKELNIPQKGIHKIRHSFANNLADMGLDLLEIQDFLRHSDPATSRIYTQRNFKRMKDAAIKL